MILTTNFEFTLYGAWWFSLIFILVSTALVLMIPKYNLSRFLKTPKVMYFSRFYAILYYLMLLFLIALPLTEIKILLYLGIFIFILGLLAYTASLYYFAISEYDKHVSKGIYSLSRHPVYSSFFIIIMGTALATGSIILIAANVFHIIAAYYISLAEEKQCNKFYGIDYDEYKLKVRRFI